MSPVEEQIHEMNHEKKMKATKLMEMALNHSQYETNERIQQEAEKWFNELIKLDKGETPGVLV